MYTATQEKGTETKRSYAFIGYAISDLIGLACGGFVCKAVQILLDALTATYDLPMDLTVVAVLLGLIYATSVAAFGCMIVWLIAEHPLSDKSGYIDLPEHCAMAVLVPQVWMAIWVFYTTKCLNRAGGKKSIPWLNMLLCLLVPYYVYFWYVRQGIKVDALSEGKTTYRVKTWLLCLLLGVLVAPFAACIALQKRINDLVA